MSTITHQPEFHNSINISFLLSVKNNFRKNDFDSCARCLVSRMRELNIYGPTTPHWVDRVRRMPFKLNVGQNTDRMVKRADGEWHPGWRANMIKNSFEMSQMLQTGEENWPIIRFVYMRKPIFLRIAHVIFYEEYM